LGLAGALEDLELLIPDMERLEAEGRERAYHREEPPRGDASWAREVERVAGEAERWLGGAADDAWAVSEELAGQLTRLKVLADLIEYAALHLGVEAERCESLGKARGECEVSSELAGALRMVDEAYGRLAGEGKRCTWLLGVKEPYTLSAAINDLTSCFHRLLDAVREKAGRYRTEGLCTIAEGADPALVEACRAWSEAERHLYNLGLVQEDDYGSLSALVKDRKVEVQVGSTAGHKAHIDLEQGTLEYYDTDDDVNKAMEMLMEQQGLDCTHIEGEGVKCSGVTPGNVKRVAAKLAAATSMDLRLAEPRDWWGGNLELMPRECLEIGWKNLIEREVCAVEKEIDEILEKL